ncbi:zinc-binding dehydrogenase [Actinomadura viridis]|uniref:zinc-dependent alcohol dehydrogenase n=1 Tax=Actinomadura viridis TaxID=58110 RepID=UPI00369D86ED
MTPLPPDRAPALTIPETGRVRLAERSVPRPGTDQVLIQVDWSGVSIGTELWMASGKMTPWEPMPYVPGYQAVGRVVATGETSADCTGEAAELAVGDLVACFAPGTHGRYVLAQRELTHRFAAPELAASGALFVQGATAANALNRAGVRSGQTVLVIGMGLVGQAVAALARLRGAYAIGTEVSPERLAVAAHCADRVLDVSVTPASEQLRESHPEGVDVVVESTGMVTLLDDALACVRNEGTFAFLGVYPDGVRFAFDAPHTKQITAVFPWFIGDRGNRSGVLRLIESGTFDMGPLISDVVPWQGAERTYQRLFTPERDRLNGIVFDWRDAG